MRETRTLHGHTPDFELLAEGAWVAARICALPGKLSCSSRLTLHQGQERARCRRPLVSVSLGLPATFLFGGNARAERQRKVLLQHGDVVVWGGPARLRHHGVATLKEGCHPLLGSQRINLTLRRAG